MSTLAFAIALSLIVAGSALIYVPAGLIVAGSFLAAAAVASEVGGRTP